MFTGEAWGFSGSQRFVQDISNTVNCIKPPASGQGCSFPYYANLEFERINAANIDSILEVGQVGGIRAPAGGTPTLYAHIDNIQPSVSSALQNLVVQAGGSLGNTTGTANSAVPVQAANSDGDQRGLPPSSSMSFLAYRGTIPAVVLTDYQDQMSSYTSQGLDDTWDPVNTINAIQQAASVISKTAWLQAQGVSDATATESCVGDVCINSLTNYHDAFGVGIAMAEDNTYYIKDASKPTWTESTWDPIGLRLFNVTSPGTQRAELVTGIMLTLVSIGAVWYSRRLLEKTL
ncbi:hypothetical protein BGZ80_000321, partial [Entomortierella chlamydospora]